jgi:hypothetical protein
LRPILVRYGIHTTDKQAIKIKEPFQELYHSHQELVHLFQKQNEKTEEQEHLALLPELINELFGPTVVKVTGMLTEALMTFESLWILFPPDVLVYCPLRNQDRLYEITKTSYEKPPVPSGIPWFQITARYFQFDGVKFGSRKQTFRIWEFSGKVPISTLGAYPVEFNGDQSLQARLVERGRLLLNFQDICYREYVGLAWTQRPKLRSAV